MKLLYCQECNSLFNLSRETKTCTCGSVSGRYITNERAEVHDPKDVGVSAAVGNGSFVQAIVSASKRGEDDWRYGPLQSIVLDLFTKIRNLVPGMVLMWVRPHAGPANSHTKLKD